MNFAEDIFSSSGLRILQDRKRPSSGLLATTFALHVCDEVDIAGFSHNCPDDSLLHYYEKKTMADDTSGSGNKSLHNYAAEVVALKQLLRTSVVRKDLTGNLLGNNNC